MPVIISRILVSKYWVCMVKKLHKFKSNLHKINTKVVIYEWNDKMSDLLQNNEGCIRGKGLEYGGNKINSYELGTWWVSFEESLYFCMYVSKFQ